MLYIHYSRTVLGHNIEFVRFARVSRHTQLLQMFKKNVEEGIYNWSLHPQ